MAAALLTPLIGAIAAQIVGAVLSIVLSIGLGMLQKAMQKKPKQSGAQGNDVKITVRQSNSPWRIIYGETRVGGVYAFVHTTANNGNLQLVIVLAGHEVAEIGDVWFDDEVVTIDPDGAITTGKYANHAAVWKYLGTADQTAATDRLDQAKWTSEHRLRGRAYIIVHLNYNVDIFPNGVPNISAVIKGKKVYNPATETTDWTDNAALCVADYLHDSTYGLGAAYGDEIDEDALAAAANICEESVSLAAGGTEHRYTINGAFDTDAKPVDILGDMLNAMAGRAIHAGGRWRIIAGAWQTPTITLSEADLRGPIKVQSLLSRRENFNAVKGQYVSEGNQYQETDFPAVTSNTFQEQDGGERVYKDIKLPFTNSAATAQRLAKIELLRARQPVTVPDVPFHLSAYRVQCGDVIGFSNDRLGWSNKYFEVQQATLVIDRSQDDAPLLGVNLTLRETDESVFDWSTSEESAVDPAPNTDLPDPFNVLAPAGVSVQEEVYVTRDGAGVKTLARVSWVGSADAFVTRYEVQYQLVGATDWIAAGETTGTALEVFDLTPGTYDFRVRAVSVMGVRSPWVTVRGQLSGLLAPPTEPQDLTIQSIGGMAVLSWTQSPDIDVRLGGRIEVRHSPATGGTATWTVSTSIGIAVPGQATQVSVPLKAGTYLMKAVDSSGIYSTNAATVETEQATALAWANVGTVAEHPDFAGDPSGVYRDSDAALKLAGVTEMDDLADVDSVVDWDIEGGLLASGTYGFAAGLDLTTVQRVRLTSHLSATVINTLALVDSRIGMVDDWLDWDGTSAASADAWVEVRKTNDDPAGSPVWADWQRCDAVELVGRGFQFRCQLESSDPAYNIAVDELSVTAEGVA